jgi:hypothetical protein
MERVDDEFQRTLVTAGLAAPDPSSSPSPKSYGLAVALSATLGVLGVQHFYLGRWLEGCVDVGLSLGTLLCLAHGAVGWAVVLAVLDAAHSLAVTIQLLTGHARDGEGRRVCFPGQRLSGNL